MDENQLHGMRMAAILVGALLLPACICRGPLPYSPAGFPEVLSLPATVTTKGEVKVERDGEHAFVLHGRAEVVRGRKWTGRITAAGFAAGDRAFLAVVENAMVTGTGWEALYRDEARTPPLATLLRTLGGEHVWASIEGWPDDLSSTVVHRDERHRCDGPG
jgi:hypothetical protein